MKKEIYIKRFNFLKFILQKDISPISKTIISSLIVILFFYTAPVLVNIANTERTEFQNNSKKILAYTLNNKSEGIENEDKILDEKDLLVDILSLNELETDTVRKN